jgi:hypothetical protein
MPQPAGKRRNGNRQSAAFWRVARFSERIKMLITHHENQTAAIILKLSSKASIGWQSARAFAVAK